jgi:signal transduction histidine kinase
MSMGRTGSQARRVGLDLAIACLVPGIQLILLVASRALEPWRADDALTIALVLLQGVPLVARRSHPWPVFAIVLVANSTYYALGLPPTGYDLGLTVALYTVAAERSKRSSLTALGLVAAELLIMKIGSVGPFWSQVGWLLLSYLLFFFSAAWAWGRHHNIRTEQVRQMVADVEREQRVAAERLLREERARIARELHDVVAHHLSLMVIQAGGARRLVEQNPRRAKEALTVIEEYGRRGLDAMPGLLRALRTETPIDELAPQPRLAELPSVIDQLDASGLSVALDIEGSPRPLPDGIELSAFRIVQEALTNTLRHAGATRAAVTLRYLDNALVLDVADDGIGPPTDASRANGHGLAGMRERAALFDGTVEVTQRPGGGCLVQARLPLPVGNP